MSDLKVFAQNLEDEARKQIDTLASTEAFSGCKIRIMPDAHAGAGCVIGFTADLGDKVVPNLVGVDIGCGMLAVPISMKCTFFDVDKTIRELIPAGFDVHGDYTCEVEALGLLCFDQLKNIDRLNRSMGTLGGGNHFIEIDDDEQGRHWLVIHSGSRNLGLQVANIYQARAVERTGGTVPNGLEYLDGEEAREYLHDMRICQRWAERNRDFMAFDILCRNLASPFVDECFTTVHNYIGDDDIVRKGAISAREGEKVLIPLNMRDGAIIGVGKGNEDWNFSAPHGAGRVMSRSKAKRELSVEDFESQMNGIFSTSVCAETLDEAPDAYKPAQEILDALEPTVEVVSRLKPVYNFKAVERRGR